MMQIILKSLGDDHLESLHHYYKNKANFPHMDTPIHVTLEDTKAYLKKMKEGVLDGRWVVWAICLMDTGDIVGTIALWNIDFDLHKAEVAYNIFPEFRRLGYLKEALAWVLDYGKNEMKLRMIEAYTGHENIASSQFLRSYGFEFVKTFADVYSDGALMDVYQYDLNPDF